MKNFLILATWIAIGSTIACGSDNNNPKQVTAVKEDETEKTNEVPSDKEICEQVKRDGGEWVHSQTETSYRRDGNFLEEIGDSSVRIDCSSRFSGKGSSCENTYYVKADNSFLFYSYETHTQVNCDAAEYIYIPVVAGTCDMHYFLYKGHCYNTYIFHNWGSTYSSTYSGWNYWYHTPHRHYNTDTGSTAAAVAAGAFAGLIGGLALGSML